MARRLFPVSSPHHDPCLITALPSGRLVVCRASGSSKIDRSERLPRKNAD